MRTFHPALTELVTVVLEYAGHFYELSTFGLDWDQAHRVAAESSYHCTIGLLMTLLGDSETRALS